MLLGEALTLILAPQSTVTRVVIRADSTDQKLVITEWNDEREVATTVCGDKKADAYSIGLRIMKRYDGVQLGMSKDSKCIQYRLFGPGLDRERAEVVARAYAKSVLLWADEQELHVKQR